jgi:hypothetical protein
MFDRMNAKSRVPELFDEKKWRYISSCSVPVFCCSSLWPCSASGFGYCSDIVTAEPEHV